ncbi:MAG: glycosyltransferase [Bryobacterales bacterium]|nr:glycosyltransferase [Bryobacterales bacterium]
MKERAVFRSFLQGGFECSTHKLKTGRRLDLIGSTRHDSLAEQDYLRCKEFGILTVREGLRWHLIQPRPGVQDFASALPILRASQKLGIQVVWDLFHFGWPDHLNIFDPAWVDALAELAAGFGKLLRSETSETPFVAPINEISFVSWAGGHAAHINPYEKGRGHELKRQLVRAAIRASDALRSELPDVRLVSPEPVIHIVGEPDSADDIRQAEEYRMAMFEAWDMLAGRVHTDLGGAESYLDIIGVNYYDRNQWWNYGETIWLGEPQYRPFRKILQEVYERYRRPMFVSETGTEDASRPEWFAYISQEVRAAMQAGVSMHGICLYPILNHPGWNDDRHCHNGLWDYPEPDGSREVYEPLAAEIRRQEKGKKEENNMKHSSSVQHDLVCLSHLRWSFVFQRPQHLMSRFARHRRVLYVEEPVFEESGEPKLVSKVCDQTGVEVITPHLPEDLRRRASAVISDLLARLFRSKNIQNPIAWFYTPMAIESFPASVAPAAMVYDCMDELTGFKGAPPELRLLEERLLKSADLVFTGGISLFEAKRAGHPRVHAFPSGVDVSHFAQARCVKDEPADQIAIARPRLGYAGVIDERMDLELVAGIAALRPDWQLIMLGPVVKIQPESLPKAPNIHWLGMKDYRELPQYFAGWDVALMPFALNDATRFISPTKTPEYLAAGLPVISTAIRDVVRPYGELGLARIACNAHEFVDGAEQAMAFGMSLKWRERADDFLQTLSWDSTWASMNRLIETLLLAIERGEESAAPVRRNQQGEAAHV